MQQEKFRRIISVGLFVVLIVIFGFTTENFFTITNFLSILRESSVIGIIAIGVSFVIITAGIDLSTGANVGLTAMICSSLLYYYQLPGPVIIVIALAVGTAAGWLNGMLITACLC